MEKKKKKKGQFRYFINLNPTGGAVLPNVFQNDFDSTQEAAPPEEPEPELFFEEPELYQTSPYLSHLNQI